MVIADSDAMICVYVFIKASLILALMTSHDSSLKLQGFCQFQCHDFTPVHLHCLIDDRFILVPVQAATALWLQNLCLNGFRGSHLTHAFNLISILVMSLASSLKLRAYC